MVSVSVSFVVSADVDDLGYIFPNGNLIIRFKLKVEAVVVHDEVGGYGNNGNHSHRVSVSETTKEVKAD